MCRCDLRSRTTLAGGWCFEYKEKRRAGRELNGQEWNGVLALNDEGDR